VLRFFFLGPLSRVKTDPPIKHSSPFHLKFSIIFNCSSSPIFFWSCHVHLHSLLLSRPTVFLAVHLSFPQKGCSQTMVRQRSLLLLDRFSLSPKKCSLSAQPCRSPPLLVRLVPLPIVSPQIGSWDSFSPILPFFFCCSPTLSPSH